MQLHQANKANKILCMFSHRSKMQSSNSGNHISKDRKFENKKLWRYSNSTKMEGSNYCTLTNGLNWAIVTNSKTELLSTPLGTNPFTLLTSWHLNLYVHQKISLWSSDTKFLLPGRFFPQFFKNPCRVIVFWHYTLKCHHPERATTLFSSQHIHLIAFVSCLSVSPKSDFWCFQ
jgi:hypothetical protein